MVVDATTVEMTLEQVRYLSAFVWVQLEEDPGDQVARELFDQLKAATVRLGVVWTYGELPAANRRPRARRSAWVREGTA